MSARRSSTSTSPERNPWLRRDLRNPIVDAEAGLEWLSPPTLCLCILLLTAGLTGDVKGRKLVFTVGLALFTAPPPDVRWHRT